MVVVASDVWSLKSWWRWWWWWWWWGWLVVCARVVGRDILYWVIQALGSRGRGGRGRVDEVQCLFRFRLLACSSPAVLKKSSSRMMSPLLLLLLLLLPEGGGGERGGLLPVRACGECGCGGAVSVADTTRHRERGKNLNARRCHLAAFGATKADHNAFCVCMCVSCHPPSPSYWRLLPEGLSPIDRSSSSARRVCVAQ
jgi:hypothetical protein